MPVFQSCYLTICTGCLNNFTSKKCLAVWSLSKSLKCLLIFFVDIFSLLCFTARNRASYFPVRVDDRWVLTRCVTLAWFTNSTSDHSPNLRQYDNHEWREGILKIQSIYASIASLIFIYLIIKSNSAQYIFLRE